MKLTPFDLNSIKSQCYQNIEYYQDNMTVAYIMFQYSQYKN